MFNPIGTYDPHAPLNRDVLDGARAFRARLTALYPCPPGSLQRIYGHWTVGHYGQDFNDYNACVRYSNGHFYLDVCGDPRDNASGDPSREHPHTYLRNGHAFGIATDDMAFANEHDFGPEPITHLTLEWLCGGIAGAAAAYGIDLAGKSAGGPYAGEPTFLTHAEAAHHPGNPAQYADYYLTGERWDWATLVPLPAGLTTAHIDPSIVGNILRARAHLYKAAL